MPIQRLHTTARYSEAVIHRGTVYLSGQLADDLSGDIRQQTRETLLDSAPACCKFRTPLPS